ncbi:hypothetical protein PRR79_28450, partial [Klebsiella pneumoniae]|nr:hypothetical protein [Klebsiella pneumoniae]
MKMSGDASYDVTEQKSAYAATHFLLSDNWKILLGGVLTGMNIQVKVHPLIQVIKLPEISPNMQVQHTILTIIIPFMG